ncbi:MAG: hypothetical protein EOL88_03795 [Bacteroidia bacterium]|nr:hypothetical protein [Bacteroidia bacterium]
MKTKKFFLLAVIPFSLNFFCSAQTIDKNEPGEQITTHKIEVYYFQYSRRFATCNSVENVTKETLAEL